MVMKKWGMAIFLILGFSLANAKPVSPEAAQLSKLAKDWQTAPGQFPPGRIKFTKDYRIVSTPAFSDIESQSGYFNFLSDGLLYIKPDGKDQAPSNLQYTLEKNKLRLTYANGDTQLFIPAKSPTAVKKARPKANKSITE